MTKRKTIRIIEKEPPEPTFSERLEERARALSDRLELEKWDTSASAVLERDIAMTLHHIDNVRALDKKLRHDLFQLELYFDTKLMQLWPGKGDHLPYLWREHDRNKLRQKEKWQEELLNLEEERRRLAVSLEEKLQPLHDRLLSVLQKHTQVDLPTTDLENGRRKARWKT